MPDKNIVHVKNSVAAPQSNGQVNRVHRDLKAMLAKLIEPVEHADWVSMLTRVEFAVHSSTDQ